jgi:hypothetical protein
VNTVLAVVVVLRLLALMVLPHLVVPEVPVLHRQ